jgi:hypothetical protein
MKAQRALQPTHPQPWLTQHGSSAKRAQKEEIKNRDQHQNQTVEFDSRAVFVANLRVGLLQLTTIKTIT